ncbi:hypothetical protein Tco_1201292 [Tanacetum coccineum]
MEAHLASKQPVQVNKISSSCEIYSSPHDTQYCMENPEQAFVDYAYQVKLERTLIEFDSHQERRLSSLGAQLGRQQDDLINKINILWKVFSEKPNDTSTRDTIGNSIAHMILSLIKYEGRTPKPGNSKSHISKYFFTRLFCAISIPKEDEVRGEENVKPIATKIGSVWEALYGKKTRLIYDKKEETVAFGDDNEKLRFKMPYKIEMFKNVNFTGVSTDRIPPSVIGGDDDGNEKTHYSDSLNLGPGYKYDENVCADIAKIIRKWSKPDKHGHEERKSTQEAGRKLLKSQQEKKETVAQSLIPYWNSSIIDDEEARDNFLKDVYTFLRKFSRIPFGVTPKVILIAWESFGEIKDALMDKQYRQEDIQELMSKLLEDVRNISEEFSEYINCPSWNRPLFYFDDDDDEYIVIWRRPKAITPDEPSEEPEDPLIMGEKELSTIPEKDKSSVENLVPIPSGSKGVSDDICDNDHSDAESLLSQDIPITSPKIDFLSEEFASKFAPIPPGMDKDEFDEEEVDCYDHDISSDDESYENIEYVEASSLNLEYDSLEEENEDQEEKEFNLEDIFQIQDYPSSFPIMDSDSFFEESDTSLSQLDHSLPKFKTFSCFKRKRHERQWLISTTTHANNSLPEYDSFLFEIEPDQGGLTSIVNSNDPLLELPEFESFHFDLDPSFPRPPPEPLDVEISLIFEPNAHVINNVDELNEDECFDPGGGEINVEVDDSFTFVTWTFLPFLTYPEVSPLLFSTKNEDTIFDPGIST